MPKEYIEREAAIQRIRIVASGVEFDNPLEAIDTCVAVIDCEPAVDVAPVVHAKWDANGRCTNCGGHAPFYCMTSTYHKSPYCFECGAKMDKEEV